VVAPGGGRPELLTAAGARSAHPAWSPDGTRLAYTAAGAGGASVRWVGVAGGSERVVLHAGARAPGRPAWSPDGRWITVALEDESGGWSVVAVPFSGGAPRPLLGNARAPRWLADGRLLFARAERSGTLDLWTVRVGPDAVVAAGSERRLTRLPAGQSVDGARGVSTDGRHLFFRTVDVLAEDVWLGEAR
jgi:Tol biopolymer transport system component